MAGKAPFSVAQYKILHDAAKKARGKFKTQQEMALALGITQQSVGALLLGKYKPGVSVASGIAELHSMSLEDLVGPFGGRIPGAPSSNAMPVGHAPEAKLFANLDVCVRFYSTTKQWSPWTVAAARAGFFGDGDLPAPTWADRLDSLESAMKKIKRP